MLASGKECSHPSLTYNTQWSSLLVPSIVHHPFNPSPYATSMATSLDRTLTQAKALPHGDPIPISDNTTHLGSISDAGWLGMEPGSSPCHFPGPASAAREDSRGLLPRGWSTCVALAANEGSWPAPSLVSSTQPFAETTALLWVQHLGPPGT